MSNNSTKSPAPQSEADRAAHLLDDWFDPIEAGLRDRVRELIQAMNRGRARCGALPPALRPPPNG